MMPADASLPVTWRSARFRRIGYIKDVILARTLDDAVFASLSSLVLLNNIEVVSALMADDAFVAELFDRLRALQPSEGGWRDLVAFLQGTVKGGSNRARAGWQAHPRLRSVRCGVG